MRDERNDYAACLFILKDSYTKIQDEVTAQMYLLKFLKFIDIDLLDLIYANNGDAKEGMLTLQTSAKSGDNQLLSELKLLKSLETAQPKNYEQIIERYLNIGEIYTKIKNYKWAHEHYDEASKLCRANISSKYALAQCLFDIGHRSAVADDVEYAFKSAKETLEIRLSLLNDDDVDIGFSYHVLSLLYDYSN